MPDDHLPIHARGSRPAPTGGPSPARSDAPTEPRPSRTGTRTMTALLVAAASAAIALPGRGLAQDATPRLSIELANDSEAERRTAAALRRLVAEHDVDRWIFTERVLVDETAIPHSHPVLTVHTRHLGNDDALLATFLHEQFHWLEDLDPTRFRGAMDAFRDLWPEVPGLDDGGARDAESTWRHLVVCDLELQAMARLIGADRARALLGAKSYYEWVYARVLDDPRVREIMERHGMVVTRLSADGGSG